MGVWVVLGEKALGHLGRKGRAGVSGGSSPPCGWSPGCHPWVWWEAGLVGEGLLVCQPEALGFCFSEKGGAV